MISPIIFIATLFLFKANSCDGSPTLVSAMSSFDILQNYISNDDSITRFDYTFMRSIHNKKKNTTHSIEIPDVIELENSDYSTFLNRFRNTGKRTISTKVQPAIHSFDGSAVYKSLKQVDDADHRNIVREFYRMFERY